MDKSTSTGTEECLSRQPRKGPGTRVTKLERRGKAVLSKSLGKDLDGAFRVGSRRDKKS